MTVNRTKVVDCKDTQRQELIVQYVQRDVCGHLRMIEDGDDMSCEQDVPVQRTV